VFIVAKTLQAFGIVNVGYAVYAGLRDGLSPSVMPTVVGMAVFYLGRLIERRA
jgi:hypothetical protein